MTNDHAWIFSSSSISHVTRETFFVEVKGFNTKPGTTTFSAAPDLLSESGLSPVATLDLQQLVVELLEFLEKCRIQNGDNKLVKGGCGAHCNKAGLDRILHQDDRRDILFTSLCSLVQCFNYLDYRPWHVVRIRHARMPTIAPPEHSSAGETTEKSPKGAARRWARRHQRPLKSVLAQAHSSYLL